MNQFLSNPLFLFTLLFISFTFSCFCLYLVLKTTKINKTRLDRLINTENSLKTVDLTHQISHVLVIALTNSIQTQSAIALSNVLLSYCKYKSDVLTNKAIDNSLSAEIGHAVLAIETLEENRVVLEGKIRQLYAQLQAQLEPSELEQGLIYAHALQQETEIEFASMEKMKLNVLKVNQVLDDVLVKLQ